MDEKIDDLRGLLFEAMIHDSVNLRQKCLWSYVKSEIEDAIKLQIDCFEEAIEDASEAYLIDEYLGHLKQFKEWSKYFLMDTEVIYIMRENGSIGIKR